MQIKKQSLESSISKQNSFPSKAEHTTSCLAGWLLGSLGGFLFPLRLGQKEPLLGQVGLALHSSSLETEYKQVSYYTHINEAMTGYT